MPCVEKLEQQFHRACMSDEDVFEAYEYLSAIDQKSSRAVRQGLLVAALVAYSRPFLNSNGRGKSSKKVSLRLESELTSEEQNLHQKVLDLRNGAIAHSDYKLRPVARWAGVSEGSTISFTPIAKILEDFDQEKFRNLVYKVMMLLKKKRKELDDKIKELPGRLLHGGFHPHPTVERGLGAKLPCRTEATRCLGWLACIFSKTSQDLKLLKSGVSPVLMFEFGSLRYCVCSVFRLPILFCIKDKVSKEATVRMTETNVSKENARVALLVGDEASRLDSLLRQEAESLEQKIEDFKKTNRVKIPLISMLVRDKLKSVSQETEEMGRLLDAFTRYRYNYVRDRLERKIRQSVSDQVPVTNTELMIVDNLSDPEIYQIYEKYKGREFFIVNENFKVADLFSDDEMAKGHADWVRGQWLFYGFFGFLFLGVVISLAMEHG